MATPNPGPSGTGVPSLPFWRTAKNPRQVVEMGHLDNLVVEQKDKEQDSSEAYFPGEIPSSLSDRIKIEYMKCFEHSPALTISKLDP